MDRNAIEFRKLLTSLDPPYLDLLTRILHGLENNLLGIAIVEDGKIVNSNQIIRSYLSDSNGLFQKIDIGDHCQLLLLFLHAP